MKKGTALWHLHQMARADELALSAKIRAMQYPGYDTGTKSQARFEHWQGVARTHFDALEAILTAMPEM